jgi:hypothetical protein
MLGWGSWTCSKLSKPGFSRLAMIGVSHEKYQELRQILEKQNGLAYSLEEAKEIGEGLLGFYLLLIELSLEN